MDERERVGVEDLRAARWDGLRLVSLNGVGKRRLSKALTQSGQEWQELAGAVKHAGEETGDNCQVVVALGHAWKQEVLGAIVYADEHRLGAVMAKEPAWGAEGGGMPEEEFWRPRRVGATRNQRR